MTDEEFPYPHTSASIEEAWKTIIRPQLVAQGGRALSRGFTGRCVLVNPTGAVCAVGALLLPSERAICANQIYLEARDIDKIAARHPWFRCAEDGLRLFQAHDNGPWPPPEELP